MKKLIALLSVTAVAACGDSNAAKTEQGVPVQATLEKSAEDWHFLTTRKIFFGHQSVGRNIMAGLREVLANEPELLAKLVTTKDPASVQGAAFIDADLGRNGDPLSKTRDFGAAIARGLKDEGAIALHKYCYVDVNENSDIPALFAAYREQMKQIRSENPHLKIVHVTMPLRTEVQRSIKDRVKMLIGREVAYDANPKRNEFNRLLMAEYSGKEPVFDLALIEATRADGSRVSTVENGDTVYAMAPEWTDDGGHLNQAGRRRVAVELLNFLSKF